MDRQVEIERLKGENAELKVSFAELSQSHVAQGARLDVLTATLARVQADNDRMRTRLEQLHRLCDMTLNKITIRSSKADVAKHGYREAVRELILPIVEAALRGGDSREKE